MDAIEKVKIFKEFNQEKYKNLAKFETFVTSLGISDFSFYIGKTSKQLKFRSLTGPEKLKLFEAISISTLLPSLSQTKKDKIQHLWGELIRLNKIFPDDLNNSHKTTSTALKICQEMGN